MHSFTITRPDDWHVHFRDHEFLKDTVLATAKDFGRALVMPNLQPPLTSIIAINDYYQRILKTLTPNHAFKPLMTFYLNEQINLDELNQLKNYPFIVGAKLYPAGVTTNSTLGAQSIKALYPAFEAMQAHDLVLQIHGEVIHGDIFDRETLFIEEHLTQIIKNFPKLRVVLEHISTKKAVEFVTAAPQTVAATITPHHLLYNRNHLLAGGIKPHYYCLPILKTERDQKALQQAIISDNNKFFAGTDSAPHMQNQKESACGCAGIYSAPYAVPLYAQVFDQLGHLNKMDAFMGHFGAMFYKQSIQKEQIEIIKQKQLVPQKLPFGNGYVIPIAAGATLQWSVHEPK